MWCKEIMFQLLDKLPQQQREDGELFLDNLFNIVNNVDSDPEIEFFLGLLNKSFLEFGNKNAGTVTLEEFSRHLLGLTLLYIKSSNDKAVWNDDFNINTIRNPLGIAQERKSKTQLLNQFEMITFAKLDHKVDINYEQLSALFKKYSTLETTRAFVFACKDLSKNMENASLGFKLLIHDAHKQVVLNCLNSNKSNANDTPQRSTTNYGSSSPRLSLFKPLDSNIGSDEQDIISHIEPNV